MASRGACLAPVAVRCSSDDVSPGSFGDTVGDVTPPPSSKRVFLSWKGELLT